MTEDAQTLVAVDPQETLSRTYAFQDNGVSWRRPHLVVLKAELRAFDVALFVEIADRDTGELRTQLFVVGYETIGVLAPTPAQTRELLRKAYIHVVCHELDELLRIDNNWQDPHIENGTNTNAIETKSLP